MLHVILIPLNLYVVLQFYVDKGCEKDPGVECMKNIQDNKKKKNICGSSFCLVLG